jgi:predicted permease
MFSDLLYRLRALFGRKSVEAEMDEELRVHFEQQVEKYVRGGMGREDAARRARLEFGGLDQVKEECRDARGVNFIETTLQDIRYGVRQLRRNPGFTIVAVLTLALGIGANTAVFNVLDAVLLRSLPVAAPQELVFLTDPDAHGRAYGAQSGDRQGLAFSEFEYLRDHNEVFSGIFAADSALPQSQVSLGTSAFAGVETDESARVRLVSGGYFPTLGVKTALGRLFTADVDRARGTPPLAVISYAYWRDRFGLDPAILGKTIRIRQTPFEIIGVTAPGFFGETVGQVPDIWIPITMQDAIYPGRDLLSPAPALANQYIWLQVVGRLKPGLSLRQANAGINVAFKQWLESSLGRSGTPEQRQGYLDQQIKLRQGARGASTLRGTFAEPIKLLMALVALVLLIACANVANLLLARGTARRREFAVRIALGAGRARLLRQLLAECLLLAFLGAAVGLVTAQWTDALLLRMVSGASPGLGAIQLSPRPDARALVFTMVVAVLAMALFGLIPALRASHFAVSPALKSGSTAVGGGRFLRRLTAGKMLVVAQVAISLILIVAAGLFVHSLAKLSEVNVGYNRERLLLFMVDASSAGYKGPAVLQLHQELLSKFSNLPGVRAATLSSNGLFQGRDSGDPIDVEGYTPKPGEEPNTSMDHVGPGYFSTLGIPVLIGREIGPQDSISGPRAAVVNHAFAKTYFPDRNPIGKYVRDTDPGNPGEAEIVGVVADSKTRSLREETRPRIYFPFFNPVWEHAAASFQIRTFADPADIGSAVRKAIQETDPSLVPIKIETMSGLVETSLGTDRVVMRLASIFGLLAILLASIGLYGVMAYTVGQRTRDIGIRVALGARPQDLIGDILGEALLIVLLGIALGLPTAVAGTRLIKSLLFGLGAVDTVVFAVAIALMIAVAVTAGFFPARRATKVDPMVALRYE